TISAHALFSLCFFFFQAEDGIRDFHVTGVQTCALPICTGAQLLAGLQERYPELAPVARLKLAVNQRHAQHDVRIVPGDEVAVFRSEEHTSELQSRENLVCRLLLEKKKSKRQNLD